MAGLKTIFKKIKEKCAILIDSSSSSSSSIPGWSLVSIDSGPITQDINNSQFGHSFQVNLNLRYKPSTSKQFSEPMLEWNEIIQIFKWDHGSGWRKIEEKRVNMHKEKPDSNTFSLWKSKYSNATYLTSGNQKFYQAWQKVKHTMAATQENREKVAIAELTRTGGKILATIIDTPALGIGQDNYATRRVLQFDLGIEGSTPRLTATQILELNSKGEITICCLLMPGVEEVVANDPRLEGWRNDYKVGNRP
ncbi:hypothetical protein C7Y66_15735 [Chroococcidiopsis sp. CCALA 051]|uniref:hypothetical protein n=1 Tax=Chroococcidiopsis sp. CCALA 051 TaxID=869949 RepID=UPI000D0D4FD4|nr:hypothetical protein [Chroococcidiopsis sp. CCALA 051]PSM48187.1 hypothetical protein C7Y66_15735 [Chroococcidiopsis sp. CCALA 051]